MKKAVIGLLCMVLLGTASLTHALYQPTAKENTLIQKIGPQLENLYHTDKENFMLVKDFLETMMKKNELGSKKYWLAWKLASIMEAQEKKQAIVTTIPTLSIEEFSTLKQHIPDELLDSSIWIIEFTDLQCPFCKRHHTNKTLQQVKDTYNDVDYVQLSFPLNFHLQAHNAAQIGLCVWRHDGYTAYQSYVNEIFSLDRFNTVEEIQTVANTVSSNDTAVANCFANGDTKKAVDAQIALGRTLSVTGTPGNIVLDTKTRYYKKVAGAVPATAFDTYIQAIQSGNYTALGSVARQPTTAYNNPGTVYKPVAPTPTKANLTQYTEFIKTAYTNGNPDAEITILEFSDYECPFCKRHHNNGTIQKTLDAYNGKVNTVLGHFPLSFHPNAAKASEGVECAGELGGIEGFNSFSNVVFTTSEKPTKDVLIASAKEIGLNETAFITCLDSGKYAQKVADHMAFGRSLGVTGTPGNIVINNKTGQFVKVSGAVPASSFDAPIKSLME